MAFDAQYIHGDATMGDYTPGSAVAAGSVIVLGAAGWAIAIAHEDIAANAAGSVAVGFGIYRVRGAGALSQGAKVYWDNVAKNVTATSAGNTLFGYLVTACSGAGAYCEALHNAFI